MIDSFEVNKYKCFENFELNNLSQINIISGKNNVGKTALLEVVSIIKSTTSLRLFQSNMFALFLSRDLDLSDINKYLKGVDLFLKYSNIEIKIKHKFIEELTDEEVKKNERYNKFEEFLVMYKNEKFEIMPLRSDSHSLIQMPLKNNEQKTIFINSSKPDNAKLTELYSAIQDLNIQKKFLKYLQILDTDIINIEPQVKNSAGRFFLRISLKNPTRSILSSELGEGTNRFIEILCVLLSNPDGIVLIDEIENGIHYTKLYDMWKAIIEIAKEEKIQLFTTTHDKESIEALIKASQDMSYNKVTSIKLFKDKENIIKPSIKKFEIFEYGIDMGADVR